MAAMLFACTTRHMDASEKRAPQVFFNVLDYGAKADGKHLTTDAIQAAIDDCSGRGGGTVVFPRGSYLTGTIDIRSNVTLNLQNGSVLLGSTNRDDYRDLPYGRITPLNSCLVCAENAENIAVVGDGCIDGQGAAFAKGGLSGEAPKRPELMRLYKCRNIAIRDVTFKDSASWATHYMSCSRMNISGVNVISRANINNDGFDLVDCENVRISNCDFDCQDDAIALKESCKKIAISNCVISSHCAAIRIGPESHGGFEDITVSNCIIHDTFHGGIKIQMCEGGWVENATFSNIVMNNVTTPIRIRLVSWDAAKMGLLPADGYDVVRGPDAMQAGAIRNVSFSNIEIKVADAESVEAAFEHAPTIAVQRSNICITGLPEDPIENITLNNIGISFPGGGTKEDAARRDISLKEGAYPEFYTLGVLPSYGVYARHVRGLRLDNVRLELEKPDMRPAIHCEDVKGLDILDLRAEGSLESALHLKDSEDARVSGFRPLN